MIILKRPKDTLMMSLDWLQWSGYLIGAGRNDLPEIECPETYRLEILEGNNIFRYRAILYNWRGQKCITMMWKPKSQLIQYNLVTFQVNNNWFYEVNDIREVMDLASQCFIYQFATFTRIDICVDFEFRRRQRSIVTGLMYDKIYCASKQGDNLWRTKYIDKMFPHDINFGSHQSACKWKLYNKSKELHVGEDGQEKQYIIDRWTEAGFDTMVVWRLEVSLTDFNKFWIKGHPKEVKGGEVLYTPKALEIEDIVDQTIYDIYCHLYDTRFQLRKNQHHSRKSNDERVYLFELEKRRIVVPVSNTDSNRNDNSIMHHLIAVIESDSAKMNQTLVENSCNALYSFVKHNHLDGLFYNIKGICLEEYIEEYRALCGEGIVKYL